MKLLITATTEARSNFASQHLAAAEYFCEIVSTVESTSLPNKDTLPPPEYIHCWFASIVFSALAMEANAQDLLTASDRHEPSAANGRRFRAEDLRRPLMERYNLLYQVALGGKRLPQDSGIAQEARALVLLRDEIVHFKTEFRSSAPASKTLEALLRARLPLNPFKCGEIFCPEQCVSAGSSSWAIRVARGFMRHFSEQTGYRLNV